MLVQLYVMVLLFSFFSCSNGKEEAKRVAEQFAESAKDLADTAQAKVCYPSCVDLSGCVTIGDLEINDIKEKGDNKYSVSCTNGYYNEKGNFVQNDVTLIIGKDKRSKYAIQKSYGLVQLPGDLKKYGLLTGAISESTDDVGVSNRLPKLAAMFYNTLSSYKSRLNDGIRINYWSWESPYGTPHGQATITNTLPFDVYNVKYHITYYRGDTTYGEDDGLAFNQLESGATKTFRFYSSNVTFSNGRARLDFELPEELALKWMLNDDYTGQEYHNSLNL